MLFEVVADMGEIVGWIAALLRSKAGQFRLQIRVEASFHSRSLEAEEGGVNSPHRGAPKRQHYFRTEGISQAPWRIRMICSGFLSGS